MLCWCLSKSNQAKSDTFLAGICTIWKLFTSCFLLTNSQTTIWTGNNSTMQKMYLSLGELGFERPCKINWSCDLDWTFHNIEDWSQTWSVTIVLSSLTSDWSRRIAWPEYWPLIGHWPWQWALFISPRSRVTNLKKWTDTVLCIFWFRERGGGTESGEILNMTKCDGNYVVTQHWFLGRSSLAWSLRELFKGFRHNISRLIYNNTANWSQKATFITEWVKKFNVKLAAIIF